MTRLHLLLSFFLVVQNLALHQYNSCYCEAWSITRAKTTKTTTTTTTNNKRPSVTIVSRQDLLRSALVSAVITTTTTTATVTAATAIAAPLPCFAFDGSGSSSYSGRTPASQRALAEGYRLRVIADVKDFNALGHAILDQDMTDGDDWIAFFIPYQRREPDTVGRTYAAKIDFIGDNGLGGTGLLLAGTFAKKGKPIESLSQVKKFNALSKAFNPIQAAGKAGDVAKAKQEWNKASTVLSEYLSDVGLPSSLSDPMYQ